MTRYLVTGGAGFIGANLVRALEARGDRVRVLDWGRAAGFGALHGTAADVLRGDVRDPHVVEVAIRGIDIVVHLAARTSVPASIRAPLDDLEHNVLGTVALLDAARRAGAARFVFASSNAAVGTASPGKDTHGYPRPVAPYGAAKLAVEGYLHAYHAAYGLPTVALRFSNAYGPFAAHKSSVVPTFLKAYLAGRPLVIYGDGSQTRDFVHVDDVVALTLRAIDASPDVVAGRLLHGGSGVATSVVELARAVIDVGGRPATIEHREPRAGDVSGNVADVTASHEAVGYLPRVHLRDGLERTMAWFRA